MTWYNRCFYDLLIYILLFVYLFLKNKFLPQLNEQVKINKRKYFLSNIKKK